MNEKKIIESKIHNYHIRLLFIICAIIMMTSIYYFDEEEITGVIPLVVEGLIIIIEFVLLFLSATLNKISITVTDKRVYGKTIFGKRVDLPLDSISSVGTSMFLGISIATSSGKISFLGIDNRDEIYDEISKLLLERQERKNNK